MVIKQLPEKSLPSQYGWIREKTTRDALSIPVHWTRDLDSSSGSQMLRGVGPSSSNLLSPLTLVMVPLSRDSRLVQAQHFCRPVSSFRLHFQCHFSERPPSAFCDGQNNGTPKKTNPQSLEPATVWSYTEEETFQDRVSILRHEDYPWSSKWPQNNSKEKKEAGESEPGMEMSQRSSAETQIQDIQVTSRIEKARAWNPPWSPEIPAILFRPPDLQNGKITHKACCWATQLGYL